MKNFIVFSVLVLFVLIAFQPPEGSASPLRALVRGLGIIRGIDVTAGDVQLKIGTSSGETGSGSVS